MNRPRVKICGITNASDRDIAVAAGADAIGVIVDVPVDTPREIRPDVAATLVDDLPPFVTSVLVTMPGSVQAAVALQDRVRADVIQVHGGLSPSFVGGLDARTDAGVIAAIDGDDSLADARRYAAAADLLLVDSTTDDGAGGTGQTHDWERTAELIDGVETPVVLAGGLTPENVAEAVTAVDPFGVDTASGVERDGGQKDHDAVRSFVARAQEGAG